ncbi:DEAD/DEAH box helicase family protein [Aerococcus suis]
MSKIIFDNIFSKKFNNFEEFENAVAYLETEKQRGDAMEFFAKFYIDYHADLFDAQTIYMEKDIPEEIRDNLKLELTDYGVDGVIVRNDNTITAYQVKFRSRRDGLTAKELAMFWAESEYADYRLIFSNCLSLPPVSEKKKNQSVVMLGDLLPLEIDFFSQLYDYYALDEREIHIPKHSPRDYQEKMISEITKGFERYDRGKLLAACGVGKTLTAMWIQEEMNAHNIIYVVPSLALIKQTLDSWLRNKNQPFEFLCVCSDQTVVSGDTIDEINLNSSDVSFPVTTSSEEVITFMERNKEKKSIIFTTYNSLDVIAGAALSSNNITFDLGIFDESHRTAGTKLSNMFTLGLSNDYIPILKRLFMTATERLVSPRIQNNAEINGETIFSMDNEEIYGPILSSINFGEAIDQGIISDYKIVLVTIEESQLEAYIESKAMARTSLGTEDKRIDKSVLLKQLVLTKSIKELKLSKVISYHSYVENAKKFAFGDDTIYPFKDMLVGTSSSSHEDIFIGHVNGKMSSSIRKNLLNNFASSDTGVITNAKCLTEGIDVPAVDAVYFADPKSSLVDIVQAVGRALRKPIDGQNKTSYIVLPVVIEDGVSMFNNINDEAFSTVYNVIQAMRSQDESLKDELDTINYNKATGRYRKGDGDLSKISIAPFDTLSIADFEEGITLRIAEINKDVDKDTVSINWTEKKSRKSKQKRFFVSIGDYNIPTFKNNLVLPTLELIKKLRISEKITRKDIVINNNNISHAHKFGVITKENNTYRLTDLGQQIIDDNNIFDESIERQLLTYYSLNKEKKSVLFPYRALLKVLKHTKWISRLEFIYCIFILQSTDDISIKESIERIFEIRDAFPRIEILNKTNQESVLKILNQKYNVNFSFADVWTSRTTTYNQFNYFKAHLMLLEKIVDENDQRKDRISLIEESEDIIDRMLYETAYIEQFDYQRANELREKYTQSY